jgi:short-subunit dehydrogenase
MAKTALITGASSGIGMEFAGIFAREGYDLVLVARDAEKLAKVREALVSAYGTVITFLPLDLASAGAPEALAKALADQSQEIDVLVNNAGTGEFGRFLDSDSARLRAILRLNVVVPTMLARLLGAGMADRGQGAILNVASAAAVLPGPLMVAFHATKAHVLTLSKGLAQELRGTGVTVTALCPGPTATGFMQQSGILESKLVQAKNLASAKEVAEYGYRAMKAGKVVAIPGFKNRVLVFLRHLLPDALLGRFMWGKWDAKAKGVDALANLRA